MGGHTSSLAGGLELRRGRGLCLLGQRVMTLCRGALGLSDPTWYIRLPPVSEDKGQYSMPRGGCRWVGPGSHRYPDRCAFRDHLGSLPVLRPTRGVGWHGWWTGCNWGECGGEASCSAYIASQPARHWRCAPTLRAAAKTGNPFRGPGRSFSTPCGPHQRGHIAVGPLCHPKIR
ncbi:hypothetical protein EDB89DRAFT_333128 [Lactarius sanguifluus]|nr:hypothetical protein EDB89DRAFT_333128 [Lactarius sanguifluus]